MMDAVLFLLANTQVVVTLLTALAILRIRTAHSLWFGAGTLVSAIAAKLLKRCIRQPRPIGAHKFARTYGMPSTHSSSIAFFGAYLALSAFLLPTHPRITSLIPFDLAGRAQEGGGDNAAGGSGTRVLLALMWLGAATAVCWSRVELGHHTPAQVLAGAALGSAVGVAWLVLWLGLDAFGELSGVRLQKVLGVVPFEVVRAGLRSGARGTGLKWEKVVEAWFVARATRTGEL